MNTFFCIYKHRIWIFFWKEFVCPFWFQGLSRDARISMFFCTLSSYATGLLLISAQTCGGLWISFQFQAVERLLNQAVLWYNITDSCYLLSSIYLLQLRVSNKCQHVKIAKTRERIQVIPATAHFGGLIPTFWWPKQDLIPIYCLISIYIRSLYDPQDP